MEPFKSITAKAAAFDRPNVDTDLIIPKQFLTRIERSGYGQFLFHNLRFLEDGRENGDFFLNKKENIGVKILIARENFGCGSSREHAAWALFDYGFRVVLAPSFGDIFRNNSFKIGLLPLELPDREITKLMELVKNEKTSFLTVDLAKQTIEGEEGGLIKFEIDNYRKERLLSGQDDISQTLKAEDKITAYEKSHAALWQAVLPGFRA